jgi:hypothetical protein
MNPDNEADKLGSFYVADARHGSDTPAKTSSQTSSRKIPRRINTGKHTVEPGGSDVSRMIAHQEQPDGRTREEINDTNKRGAAAIRALGILPTQAEHARTRYAADIEDIDPDYAAEHRRSADLTLQARLRAAEERQK